MIGGKKGDICTIKYSQLNEIIEKQFTENSPTKA